MSDAQARERLKAALQECYSPEAPEPFVPGKTRIPLITPGYGWEEVWEVLDSLLSTELTMGRKVERFERMFAEYVGVRHAVMVNSGSSANLLALSVLVNPQAPKALQPGDEVITPAVTWATTVFPIINVGLMPVLVDVDADTFDISPSAVEAAITPRTRAIMLVHLLGKPCDMDAIMDIARRHNLLVIEDSCEAHGAEYGGRRVGSFGALSTFSFYFSHHITTIEGGIVLTDDADLARLARAMRVFGWVRGEQDQETLHREYPEIDPRFLFTNVGYNLRPTELQAAFGIRQLPRLDAYIETRRENARYWREALQPVERYLHAQDEREGERHAWFAFPISVAEDAPFQREDLVRFLEARNVETRSIMAGNIAEQPVMRWYPHRVAGDLPNARRIHRNSFLIPNHHGVGEAERAAIATALNSFVGERTGAERRPGAL